MNHSPAKATASGRWAYLVRGSRRIASAVARTDVSLMKVNDYNHRSGRRSARSCAFTGPSCARSSSVSPLPLRLCRSSAVREAARLEDRRPSARCRRSARVDGVGPVDLWLARRRVPGTQRPVGRRKELDCCAPSPIWTCTTGRVCCRGHAGRRGSREASEWRRRVGMLCADSQWWRDRVGRAFQRRRRRRHRLDGGVGSGCPESARCAGGEALQRRASAPSLCCDCWPTNPACCCWTNRLRISIRTTSHGSRSWCRTTLPTRGRGGSVGESRSGTDGAGWLTAGCAWRRGVLCRRSPGDSNDTTAGAGMILLGPNGT